MTSPVVTPSAEQLQAAYVAARYAQRLAFEQLAAEGAFRAPEHLQPGLQGGLDLGDRMPRPVDEIRAEAG